MLHVCGQLRGPRVHVRIMFSYPCVGLKGRQFLKGDMAFLDFSSHHFP